MNVGQHVLNCKAASNITYPAISITAATCEYVLINIRKHIIPNMTKQYTYMNNVRSGTHGSGIFMKCTIIKPNISAHNAPNMFNNERRLAIRYYVSIQFCHPPSCNRWSDVILPRVTGGRMLSSLYHWCFINPHYPLIITYHRSWSILMLLIVSTETNINRYTMFMPKNECVV